MGKPKKNKNMTKDYKKLMKKDRENKMVFGIRQFIMFFGNIAIPIYIGCSSFLIAYLFIIITYNANRLVFLNYLNCFQGGALVAGIFWIGVLVVIMWGLIGLLSMYIYKSYLKLKLYGFYQPKGMFEKAGEVNEKDLENWKKKVK